MDEEKRKTDYVLTPSDILSLFKRSKKQLILCAFLFSFLFLLFAFRKPLTYPFEASFREKGVADSQLASSLTSLLTGMRTDKKSEAEALITSNRILSSVIEQLNLQGEVIEQGNEPSYFQSLKEKVLAEWAYLRNEKYFSTESPYSLVEIVDINYHGELPKSFHLSFLSPIKYQLKDVTNGEIIQSALNEPVYFNGAAFTVIQTAEGDLSQRNFIVNLEPMKEAIRNISDQLLVEFDRTNSNLIELSIDYPSRLQGATLLNAIMYTYQDFLKEEQHKIAKEQIAYLQKREAELGSKLRETLNEYAHSLSVETLESGFPDTTHALNHLSSSFKNYYKASHDVDLAIKRHEIARNGKIGLIANQTSGSGGFELSQLLKEINSLKQQRDSVELALKQASGETASNRELLNEQLASLDQVKRYRQETREILEALQKGMVPENIESLSVANHPKFLIKDWLHHIEDGLSLQEFGAYLSHLYHYFEIYQKTLREHITHQSQPLEEFQGITLQTARKLYVDYSTQVNLTQKKINELQFYLEKLDHPTFEITSLSSFNQDPMVQKTVQTAREIALSLQDTANHSNKERDRLQDSLNVQKTFLVNHLKQAELLTNLEEALLKKKINGLQNAFLSLIQQEIAILEDQVNQWVNANLKSLQHEKEFLETDRQNLLNQMANLPDRWVSEQIVTNQMQLYQKTVEEIAKLTESANISHNLKIMQSAPLDLATPAPLPNSPKLLFFSILGAVMGTFFGISGLVALAAMKGVQVSEANLKELGAHVVGTLNKRADRNLPLLRRVMTRVSPFRTPELPSGQSLLILGKSSPQMTEELSLLLSQRGFKVLLFNHESQIDDRMRLREYLEESDDETLITKGTYYDTLHTQEDEETLFELIGSSRFQDLLEEIQDRYDFIIFPSKFNPVSPECESLLTLFDHALIGLKHETVDEASPLIRSAIYANPQKKISFFIDV
ncbi:MAG: hypothetical protein WD595_06950 [Waddliaceae bacterium]